MRKRVVYVLIGLVVLIGGYFLIISHQQKGTPIGSVSEKGIKDISYTIDGKKVTLQNGVSETEAAPGSAAKIVTRYFGNEAMGDLNGDGATDTAFILTQETGGSGTFYYVVVALKTNGGYTGTNAVFLGDRIAPQTTEIRDGVLIVNYADRKEGEPMSTAPSVGVSKYLKVQGDQLTEVNMDGTEQSTGQSIMKEGTMVCLPHRDTSGPQTLECAFGIHDDNGDYYALKDTDPNYTNVSAAPMGKRVRVEGTFTPRSDSDYQDIGVIAVTSITAISMGTTDTGGGTDGSPGDVVSYDSGVEGTVMLGPTCPVIQNPLQDACADKPYSTLISIFKSSDPTQAIAFTNSDEEGVFKVTLPPGQYIVGAGKGNLPRCAPASIMVGDGSYATTTISCDTGIR